MKSLLLTPDEVSRFCGKIGEPDDNGCTHWLGQLNNNGYGLVYVYRDRGQQRCRYYAHRVSFFLATGIDPIESFVRHQCDIPSCVNPHHLLTGSQKENIRDAVERGRMNTDGLQSWRDGRDQRMLDRLDLGVSSCSRCKSTKPVASFYSNRANPHGLSYNCRECCLDIQREYRHRKAAS